MQRTKILAAKVWLILNLQTKNGAKLKRKGMEGFGGLLEYGKVSFKQVSDLNESQFLQDNSSFLVCLKDFS